MKRTPRMIALGLTAVLLVSGAIRAAPVVSVFKNMYASQNYVLSGPAVDSAREAGYRISAEICDEGFVLLKNDNGMLPLRNDIKLNVFGDDAYNFVFGAEGTAGAKQNGAVGIFEAMDKAGIAYNHDLDSIYRKAGLKGDSQPGKADWHMLSDDELRDAGSYSDTAIIVLSSMEVEADEVNPELLQPSKGSSNKAAMIRKICESFEHVIVIVNSGNVMELGFTEEYPSVGSVLWVGSPGPFGCTELMRVLKGEVNPSGHTVDTWPVSIEKEPGFITYGDNTYSNIKDKLHVLTYNEGIYVGYRYYETWFEGDETAYRNNVVYPFGHGLSYTSFKQELAEVDVNNDTVKAKVKVTNTGSVSGKDVVQLYFMPPWNAESGIEKSVIELGGFAKTSDLAPGASETVEISYALRDMSSYSKSDACYVLEAGDYKICIGKNVHDAAAGSMNITYSVPETIKYTTDDTTCVNIRDLFDYAQGSYENIVYMSRSDKAGTFPVRTEAYIASQSFIDDLKAYENYYSDYSSKSSEPVMGADNGIKLSDLKGLSRQKHLKRSFNIYTQ